MDINKIITRAKSMLLTPRSEWPVVAAEPDTIGGLYSGYIVILAAIPAIVRFLSSTLIGVSVPFLGSYRLPITTGLTTAVLTYVLALVGTFIVALIVDALAPTFGAEKNRVQALKTVAYAYTAYWVVSIIGIIPGLGLLAALAGGIYSVYLLNMGLPFTMKCPRDKAIGYTAVSIVVAIIIGWVLALIVGSVAGLGLGIGRGLTGFSAPGYSRPSGDFAPGTTGAALQAWTKKMADASKQVEAAQKSGDPNAQANAVGQMIGAAVGSGGKVESLAPDQLKPFLPDAMEGLKRTQLSVDRSSALGVQISKATATYADEGQRRLNLEITDTGSLKGLVGFASGWAGVEQDTETDTGYDKIYKSGGQLVHEKWDSRGNFGEYGVVVGDRFSVKVSGNAASIDELKAGVASVNLAGLEALKNQGVQAN
ncbi:MAG: Yip1 family protein [Steroidobacteraceae bacterium]